MVSKSSNNFQISPETNLNIRNEIKNAYKEVVNSNFRRRTLTKGWKIISLIIFITGIILIISGMIYFITSKPGISEDSSKKIIFAIFGFFISGFILFLTSIILFFISSVTKQKIRNHIVAKADQFYKSVAKNATNINLQIDSINKKFSLKPQKFIIKPDFLFNEKVKTENVINGYFNNQFFNLGSIIETVIKKNSDGKEEETYNRYQYLIIKIPDYDYVTTIKPEDLFSRFANRNLAQLESKEFTKMFAVDYQDPIRLRKLFEPKVMLDMVDYGKSGVKIPNIYLNHDTVTICLDYMDIISPAFPDGCLLCFNVNNNIEKTIDSFINTIESDLNALVTITNWLKLMRLL